MCTFMMHLTNYYILMEIKTKLTFQIKGLQIKFDPATGIFQNKFGLKSNSYISQTF